MPLRSKGGLLGGGRSSPSPLRAVTRVPVDTGGLGRLDHGGEAVHRIQFSRVGLVFRQEEPSLLCVAPPESWNSVGILFVPCFRFGVRKTQNRFSRFSHAVQVKFRHFCAFCFQSFAFIRCVRRLALRWVPFVLWLRKGPAGLWIGTTVLNGEEVDGGGVATRCCLEREQEAVRIIVFLLFHHNREMSANTHTHLQLAAA